MSRHFVCPVIRQKWLLGLVLLLCPALPAQADSRTASACATISPPCPSLFALELWGMKVTFGDLANRTNVIRFCMVIMAVALFIMLKKFEGTEQDPFSPRLRR